LEENLIADYTDDSDLIGHKKAQKRCRGHYYDGMQILVKLVRLIACGQAKITWPWVCRYRVAAIWQRFPERLQGKQVDSECLLFARFCEVKGDCYRLRGSSS
jgi:hypothetical protein